MRSWLLCLLLAAAGCDAAASAHGTPQECGGSGQPCCASRTCNTANLACFIDDAEVGRCEACGGAGDPCCRTEQACNGRLSCDATVDGRYVCLPQPAVLSIHLRTQLP